jgi:pyruvate dehydrogenase E1 component beta subunit
VTVVTYSLMTNRSLEAAERLAAQGISVEVVDLRTLSPMDMPTVLESVRRTRHLVVVHEAIKRGGIGGDIAATVAEEAFDSLDGPIVRVAGRNTTIPFNPGLQRGVIPSVDDIVAGIQAALQGRPAAVR